MKQIIAVVGPFDEWAKFTKSIYPQLGIMSCKTVTYMHIRREDQLDEAFFNDVVKLPGCTAEHQELVEMVNDVIRSLESDKAVRQESDYDEEDD